LDPRTILDRARSAALEGRHEEALRDLVWFHEHALEYDRALYGVRLSFALGYWSDLANVYEPARKALHSLKARNETALLEGNGNRDLFHDVVSVNRELRRPNDTYKLFLALGRRQPALAKDTADLAIDAIVEAGAFKLASRYLPHPETYLLWLSDRLNRDLECKGVSPRYAKRRREAYVRNYCHDVGTALKLLKGLGNREAASAALVWAIALVQPKRARAMVGTLLIGK
jgi:hypothetical protein